MTTELTLENIRTGAFPSDAHAVGFLLGEIDKLRGALQLIVTRSADTLMPLHAADIAREALTGNEPCEQRSEVNSIDDVAAICHSVTGLCCHILGSPGGPCTIGNCAAVRGYLGGPEFAVCFPGRILGTKVKSWRVTVGELTRWQVFVNWLLEPYTWTQCKDLNDDGYYCQRRCWHRGAHKYHVSL